MKGLKEKYNSKQYANLLIIILGLVVTAFSLYLYIIWSPWWLLLASISTLFTYHAITELLSLRKLWKQVDYLLIVEETFGKPSPEIPFEQRKMSKWTDVSGDTCWSVDGIENKRYG